MDSRAATCERELSGGFLRKAQWTCDQVVVFLLGC
jgi:hypothetical protein